ADRNRSHWSTSKTPSYTKSVSWQHHRDFLFSRAGKAQMSMAMVFSAVAIFHSLLLLVVPN
ncbi:hypothetical protein, partial [Escherichia coli]|uniref:hypothetical protein n=1 Tax=Escherichia coli TaxID=562 RepID=UPI001BE60640